MGEEVYFERKWEVYFRSFPFRYLLRKCAQTYNAGGPRVGRRGRWMHISTYEMNELMEESMVGVGGVLGSGLEV
jgi:hypothetical protein